MGSQPDFHVLVLTFPDLAMLRPIGIQGRPESPLLLTLTVVCGILLYVIFVPFFFLHIDVIFPSQVTVGLWVAHIWPVDLSVSICFRWYDTVCASRTAGLFLSPHFLTI